MTIPVFWCGTDESLREYQQILERFQAAKPADFGVQALVVDDESPKAGAVQGPRLFSRLSDGIGVIQIEGLITNKVSWWNAFAGLTAYQEVREALAYAAADSSVSEILLLIRSPGGVVAGLSDTAEMIRRVRAVKPIIAFTDAEMASAAYWLASPAKRIYASQDAVVGSLGTVRVHFDYTGQMEQDGVKATIFRSGPKKFIGNPYEKLSSTAKDDIQAKIDYMAGVFIDFVAEQRGVSAKSLWDLDGGTFIGTQALEKRLVDDILLFDDVVGKLQRRIARRRKRNGGFNMKKTYAVTAKSLAALAEQIAAGKSLEDAVGALDVPDDVKESLMNATNADEPPQDSDPSATEPDAGEDGTATTPAVSADGSVDDSVDAGDSPDSGGPVNPVALLKEQLKEKDAELIEAKIELRELQARVDGYSELEAKMKEIIVNEVAGMQVALGVPVNKELAQKPPEHIVTLYEETLSAYTEAFPIGRQSREDADDATPTASGDGPKVTRLDLARLQSVKVGK